MSVNKRKIHFIRPDQQYDFTVPSGTTFYENHRIATAVSTLKVVLPRALSQLDHTGMMKFAKQIKTSWREQSRKKKKNRMLVHQELKLNFCWWDTNLKSEAASLGSKSLHTIKRESSGNAVLEAMTQ